MAETIEYNNLITFIKNEIIEDRVIYALRIKKIDNIDSTLFTFNPSNGKITTVYKPDSELKLLISLGSHYSVSNIFMIIDTTSNITYEVNNIKINSLSYIENKPIETALVLSYLIKDKHFSKLSRQSSSNGESSDYVFNFEDDGSLVLSKKNKDGKLEEIESISMAIREEMQNSLKAQQTKEIICKEIFGSDNNTCNKHFISILGRAGLNMLQNIGEAPTNTSIINNLNNAKVNIKYEILKNLDWKMKNVNEKKLLVSVDEWINILEENNKDGKQYREYLNKNTLVKDLLQSMVDHINNNSRLLEEKYKETIDQPISSQKRRNRLSKKEIDKLRAEVINEKNILNSSLWSGIYL
jgi:hypothetical protein